MKKFTMTITFIFLSFFCFNCPPEDQYSPRKLKPYDPVKARAVIVENFNITEKIIFPDGKFYFTDPDRVKITAPYDLFEYNNNIYVHIAGTIQVFDKQTLQKNQDITINFPKTNFTDDQYNEMKKNLEPFYDHRNIMFGSQGFIVIGNNALLLCFNQYLTAQNYLFLIDLATGDAVLIDDEEELGIQFKRNNFLRLMGYDKINDLVWFRIFEDNSFFFYFYKYNESLKAFNYYQTKIAPYSVGRNNLTSSNRWGANIQGDEVWYNCYKGPDPAGNIKNIGLNKRFIDDPETSLHFIDVEYLGTLSIPQSIAYDEPYIWIMVERENQIQMLKLLPNE